MNLTSVGEINFYKGFVKVVFDRKFALNSPASALNKKKKGKVKRRKIELIRLR